MFGFLPSPCSVCSEANHTVYRKYFCGLSSALAREYGPVARFFTNRDGTFFSILAASQLPSEPVANLTTCCNPFGKKRELCDSGIHASYAAAVSVCGVATKLHDDSEDEAGCRKHLSSLGSTLVSQSVAKATRVLDGVGFPTSRIQSHLKEQQRLEGECGGDWSIAATPASTAFGAIFEHSGKLIAEERAGAQYKSLSAAGQALGRIVYLVDAFEDREQDALKGRFNPLLKRSDNQAKYWFEEEYDSLKRNFSKIECFHHRDLLDSILLEGVLSRSAVILGMSNRSSVSGRKKSSRPKKRKKKDSCWDHCDCGGGNCCGSDSDGSDSGGCDCNCCDGCDC